MPHFYLIRHAHAVWSPDEMRPLSERGQDDAQCVAGVLAGVRPVAIYSSPYIRARQTVEPLAARSGLAIEEISALREMRLTTRRLDDFEAAVKATWNDFHFAFPDGETNAEARARASGLLRQLLTRHGGGGFVLATHGTLLTLLLNALDPSIGFDFWKSLSMPDVYRIDVLESGGITRERLWNAV